MQKPTVPNICPECNHQFRGHGFDGIDAHWRAKHEHIMPYSEAWPLISSGAYPRKTGSIEDFSGCLAKKGTPKLTIAQIKKITEDAWAVNDEDRCAQDLPAHAESPSGNSNGSMAKLLSFSPQQRPIQSGRPPAACKPPS